MKSAHERAAYLRQHQELQQLAAGSRGMKCENAIWRFRVSKGALRRRKIREMRAQDGSSSPDAAAAAALNSSAAARRTKRHRWATSRQLKRRKAANLMKRLANKHARACISLRSSSSAQSMCFCRAATAAASVISSKSSTSQALPCPCSASEMRGRQCRQGTATAINLQTKG